MITGLHHIGIAVEDLDSAIAQWQKVTEGRLIHRETVAEQRVEVAVIEIGLLHVELLRPTSGDSPIAKFIAARGAGIHHLALQADVAQIELERLKSDGVRLIDEVARIGAEDTRVGFIYPKAVGGVLLEIVESAKK
ncbi:methylmalonyl-CoA epimerase [bacterium]|nr:methylmalonyl-CoA epimerase [bacterium]MBU1984836.1 methylmalonyl-CoA epimerase [bacterium]